MERDQAAETLQVIRTLMERTALYRRALGPMMLWCGILGVAGGVFGYTRDISTTLGFCGMWLGIAVLAVAGTFALARRQAIKDHEPFWSPPTRRVAQALLPALVCGFVIDLVLLISDADEFLPLFVILSALFYGCAVHAAGFYTARGLRWFGWALILAALGLLFWLGLAQPDLDERTGHLLMGGFFGVSHLAYGAYLQLTRKRTAVV